MSLTDDPVMLVATIEKNMQNRTTKGFCSWLFIFMSFIMYINQIQCKIESTDAALKGQTVSSSYKPAKLTNGLSIQVPPFIESGDIVIINTRSMEYVKKI